MNDERLMQVLRAPHVSEKATMVGEKFRQYVFKVAKDANKHEIKAAVEKMFDVKVEGVTVSNIKPKLRVRQGYTNTRKKAWKKASVKLAEGQKITFIEA